MSDDGFVGWSLESWSLQHELLELRFDLLLVFESERDIELYVQANKNPFYRAKGVFARPTRMTFSNFVSPAKVERVAVSRRGDVEVHRFSLQNAAFVEIEAGAYVSARW